MLKTLIMHQVFGTKVLEQWQQVRVSPCIDLEKTIHLPFAPFAGLSISIGDRELNITHVEWLHDQNIFWCTTETRTEDFRSESAMMKEADDWEQDGWEVNRDGLTWSSDELQSTLSPSTP